MLVKKILASFALIFLFVGRPCARGFIRSWLWVDNIVKAGNVKLCEFHDKFLMGIST